MIQIRNGADSSVKLIQLFQTGSILIAALIASAGIAIAYISIGPKDISFFSEINDAFGQS